MKKLKTIVAVAILSLTALTANAQRKWVVELNNGTKTSFDITEIKQIYSMTNAAEDNKINGYEYVDLGLPSGTKWATMNVGATSPEEYGDYYAWGETETKSDYSWSTYLTSIGGTMSSWQDCGTNKDPLKDYVYPNEKSIAGTKYDVAHVKWGGTWKMPTLDQIKELYNSDYCTTTWTSNYNGTGVAGCIVTSKVEGYEGNSIFIPAAGFRDGSSLYYEGFCGYYWSATPISNCAYYAYYLGFYSGDIDRCTDYRYYGRPVRPVSE